MSLHALADPGPVEERGITIRNVPKSRERPPEGTRATSSRRARVRERWVGRGIRRRNGILALVTEDVTWEDPSIDGTAHGLAAARRYIERLFHAFPDIAWAMPMGLFISPDDDDELLKVGQPWACRGTALGKIDPPGFAPTGKPFALEGFDVWSFGVAKAG